MLKLEQRMSAHQRPLAKGQPIRGSALNFRADPLQFLVQQYLLGMLVVNAGPGDHFSDFVTFMRVMLNVVLGQSPRFAFRLPPYQRAKARLMQLAQHMIDEHRASPVEGRECEVVRASVFMPAQRRDRLTCAPDCPSRLTLAKSSDGHIWDR